MAENIEHFQLSLIHPTDAVQAALQGAYNLVAFSLQMAENPTVDTLQIPNVMMQVSPSKDNSISKIDICEKFKTWIIANGIRDCVEAIGPSLEWARKILCIYSIINITSLNENNVAHLSGEISGKVWTEKIVKFAEKFENFSLKNKFDYLQSTYQMKLPELTESILTINKARNCMSHREGTVGKQDCNTNEGLNVSWIKFQLGIIKGGMEEEIKKPIQVFTGDTLTYEVKKIQKIFPIGGKVKFDSTEFADISWTFLIFSQQIGESINGYLKNKIDKHKANL